MDLPQNESGDLARKIKKDVKALKHVKKEVDMNRYLYIDYRKELRQLVSDIEKGIRRLKGLAKENKKLLEVIYKIKANYYKVTDSLAVDGEIVRTVEFIDQGLLKRCVRSLDSIDPFIFRYIFVVVITIGFLYYIPL